MNSVNLNEAFDYAAKNPNSDFAKELQKALGSGALDQEAQKYGIDTSVFKPKPQPQETGVVQGVAQAVAKPFLGFASQARNVARTAQGEILQGQQEYDYGYLGKVKSFGSATPDIEGAKAILRGAGAGAGVASNIGVGGAAKTIGTGILSRTAPKFIQLAGQGAVSGALAGGGQSLQEGQSAEDVLANTVSGALVGAVASPVIGGAASLAAKPITRAIDVASKPLETFKSDVLKNVNKALSIQGKKSIGQAVNVAPEKRFTAFETLYDLAPEIKVRDEFGQEVPFSPTEANFQQFGEALYKAKNNIWSKIDSSLKQATQKGIEVDITPTLDDLNTIANSKYEPVDVREAAIRLSDELVGMVSEKGTVPIEGLSQYNARLNKKITGQLQGTSNNAIREVEAITAKNISESTDNTIENLAGKEFAQLKDSYSSLRAIENDTVRRMQQELRMLDTGLADFMNQYGTADMISGVVSLTQGNAAPLLRGVGTKIAANYMKSLRQPSKYLQDAFKQIDKFKKGEGIIPAVQELKKNSKLNRGSVSLNAEDYLPKKAESFKNDPIYKNFTQDIVGTSKVEKGNLLNIKDSGRYAWRAGRDASLLVDNIDLPDDAFKSIVGKSREDVIASLEENINKFNSEKSSMPPTDINKINKVMDYVDRVKSELLPKKAVSSLEQEAKGKTLEEFVEAQDSFYHTTKADNVGSIEKNGFNGEIGDMSKASGGDMQKGVFLYPNKSSAEIFGKNFKNPSILETKVNGKIYDANANTKYGWEDDLQTQEIAKDPNIINQLKKDGYIGVKSTELGTDAVFVFDPSVIKTKSQLTDIWKKANKK